MKKRLSVFVSLLLVQCILFSLAACQKDNADTENPTTDPADSVFGYFEENYESYTLYDDILSAYAQAQAADYYGGDVQQCGNISPSLVEEMQTDTAENSEYELVIVYVYVDLCDDNEPELFIGRRHKHHPDKFRMYDAWGCKDGKPHRLFGDRDFRCGHYEFFSDGRFCFTEEDTANANHCIYYELAKNNTDPVLIEQLRWEKNGDKETFYRFDADGTGGEIDESQYRSKKDAYRKKSCHTDDLQNWYEKHPQDETLPATTQVSATAYVPDNGEIIADNETYRITRVNHSTQTLPGSYDLFQLHTQDEASAKINEALVQDYEKYVNSIDALDELAQANRTASTGSFFYNQTLYVKYRDERYLSLYKETESSTGGQVMRSPACFTFDLTTGEQLTLDKLLQADTAQVNACIQQGFAKYLMNHYEIKEKAVAAESVLPTLSVDTVNYYIDENGSIQLVFGYYALGTTSAMYTIPLELTCNDRLETPSADVLSAPREWRAYISNEGAITTEGNIWTFMFNADNTFNAARGRFASEGYESGHGTFLLTDNLIQFTISEFFNPVAYDDTVKIEELTGVVCTYELAKLGGYLLATQTSETGMHTPSYNGMTVVYAEHVYQ